MDYVKAICIQGTNFAHIRPKSYNLASVVMIVQYQFTIEIEISTIVSSPVTTVGVSLSVVSPVPSCPQLLEPQQLTPPLVSTAHVW